MIKIEILGSGCTKCQQLANNAEAAAQALGLEFAVEKVTDVGRIADYGVMLTPALVVNGEVKSFGRLLTPEKIRPLLAD
jgi:small redox-active disulfide protein 2